MIQQISNPVSLQITTPTASTITPQIKKEINVPAQVQAQALAHAHAQAQAQTMMNSNVPKYIELPKVGPNQQLFSLNTQTNQIVQLTPGLTTAALGPMERLLIVPAGINSQQLLQCLNQGQIHFNNIGQAAPSNDLKTTGTTQAKPQPTPQIQGIPSNKKFTPAIAVEPKPKKSKAKKTKAETNKNVKSIEVKPAIVKGPDGVLKQVVVPPPKTSQSFTTATVITSTIQSTTVPKIVTVTATKPLSKLTNTSAQLIDVLNATGSKVLQQAMVVPTQQKNAAMTIIETSKVQNVHSKNLTVTVNVPVTSSNSSAQMPPLINVNPSPMISPQCIPRVQTIQLTPQKQQLLKNVQMQIQNLSGRLQNKNLLASIRSDLSPNNPLCNKPLPVLTNINAMNDMEIYQALQRLFIEQQNILATGKIIPTIPASGFATSTNVPMASPISISVSATPVVSMTVTNASPVVSTTANTKLKTTYVPRTTASQPVCIVPPQQQFQSIQTPQPLPQISVCQTITSIATPVPIVSTAPTNKIKDSMKSNNSATISNSVINGTPTSNNNQSQSVKFHQSIPNIIVPQLPRRSSL